MNPLRNAGIAVLLVLVWSGDNAQTSPAAALEKPSAQNARHATADSTATASTSSKALQAAFGTSAAPPRSAAAVHATQQLVDFLTHLSSTSDITLERAAKQFGGALTAEDDAFVYRSSDFGKEWNYGVKVLLPSKAFKAGFNFCFYNSRRDADPTPICALSLHVLRKQLVAHGYAEKFGYSEIGSVDSVEFVRNDIVLTVLRWNLLMAPNGDECFNAIQTIDGR
ncbi:hypothetical protein [Pseudomonas marginalis]|uniref:hypothetical protein n=1 Tax=Pseudomonas marginalis TaxID=298 RepID=UPI0005FC0C97|nr:hypothetical protein [Pseudomonas marginalis]KJZ52960.1 hypothetical protein VC37_17385 [Pseudomonas marginalis]KJZ54190.1 hypothetical protein VC36_25055 [Pseudomonas marginalis]